MIRKSHKRKSREHFDVLFVRKRVSALFNIPELFYISNLLNPGKSLEHYFKHKGQKVAWNPCEVTDQDMALIPSYITVSFLGGERGGTLWWPCWGGGLWPVHCRAQCTEDATESLVKTTDSLWRNNEAHKKAQKSKHGENKELSKLLSFFFFFLFTLKLDILV